MKINWLDESPLTYEEAIELLSRSHEKRLEMEDKNKWDAYVNDFTFLTFVRDTYYYMLEEVKKEINIDEFYYYPKIKDLNDWGALLESFNKKLAKDILKQEKKENIWEVVEHYWTVVFRILYLI